MRGRNERKCGGVVFGLADGGGKGGGYVIFVGSGVDPIE